MRLKVKYFHLKKIVLKNSDFLFILLFIISFSGIAEQTADSKDEDSEDEEVCEEMS